MEGSHTPPNGTIQWRLGEAERDIELLKTQVLGEEGLPVMRRAIVQLAQGQRRMIGWLMAAAIAGFGASVTFVVWVIQRAVEG